MTSQQLAKLCGVSKTTISRVINNDSNVKEETRQMVLAAMDKYNFVPIASARRLAGIDSNIIGLFIMDINVSDSTSRVSKSTYFSQLINLIIDKANNCDLHVLVFIITSEKQLTEVKNLLMSRTIFSGVFIGAFNQSPEIDSIINLGYPIIIIDHEQEKTEEKSNILFINLDNFRGAYEATRLLIELGHTRIGHITGDLRKLSGTERLDGYKHALKEAKITLDDGIIFEGDFQEMSGYLLAKKLVEGTDVSAIFTANDGMAIGAIKAMKALGLRIPEDISIVGFDNTDTGNYITPTLSTIDGHFEEVARNCIDSLEYYIGHKYFEKTEIKISTELVLRESTTIFTSKNNR